MLNQFHSFAMGLHGSQYDCHDEALIAASHVSLITSFKPLMVHCTRIPRGLLKVKVEQG